MSLGDWILLIFVGVFLLLMLAAIIAWFAQLNRGHRRAQPRKSRKRNANHARPRK